MKCQNCKANWHCEDDGGCYINRLKEKKNGEYYDGCRLSEKTILKEIDKFKNEEDNFYINYFKFLEKEETNERN